MLNASSLFAVEKNWKCEQDAREQEDGPERVLMSWGICCKSFIKRGS